MFFKTLKQVFSQIKYSVFALLIAVGVFAVAVWLPNIKLIVAVFSSSMTFLRKIYFLFSLFNSITTNFTVVSAISTILISLLFGINLALLVYFVRLTQTRRTNKVGSALSIGGLIGGLFGIGCASCGTFILSSVFSMLGFTGILYFLPLGGAEFGILGVILLIYAIVVTIKKINRGQVCDIE